MSRQGNKQKRTVGNVKDFWNKEANEWGSDPRVTIRDHYFRLLEIDTILPLIKGRSYAIDIGCGTGFSSLFYAEVVNHLVACDYAESMVHAAQRFLKDKTYYDRMMKKYAQEKKPTLHDNISFEEGNIIDLHYPDASFDVAIVERVLINLPEQSQQMRAITEISRILNSNGRLALVEVTHQGHAAVDRLRTLFQLPKLEKYWHNLYLDESKFEAYVINKGFSITKKVPFEVYQFLTKVVHPLVTAPHEPRFMSGFNNAARIIAKRFPNYGSVMKSGLRTFLKDYFRPLLKKYDPTHLNKYDEVMQVIIETDPDFTNCSHQVLYVLDKKP